MCMYGFMSALKTVLQYLDDTQVNWKSGMLPFIGNSRGGGCYRLSVPVCGEWGVGLFIS